MTAAANPWRISSDLECFPLVKALSLYSDELLINWKHPYKTFQAGSCFAKIITDVFPLGRCVNSHLNSREQQTAKTFIFNKGHLIID